MKNLFYFFCFTDKEAETQMNLTKNGRQNLGLYDTRALVHHSADLSSWMVSKDSSKSVILSRSQSVRNVSYSDGIKNCNEFKKKMLVTKECFLAATDHI